MYKKIALALIIIPLLFVAIMTATQFIPNSWVQDNVKRSQDIIHVESLYHDAYHVPQVHWLAGSDGYTDEIFLQQQIMDRSNGVFYGAMMPTYDRYWHGYSIFLRPLLVFFDLSYIRQFLVICFIVLLVVLSYLISKYISLTVAILFGIALALVNPPVIMISLQYSNMFLLMLMASIVLMLLLAAKRPKHEIFIFFTVIGSLTSFFDLLTTPSITLGVPLLLYIAYRVKDKDRKGILKDTILCALLWGTGYFIAWFAKWLIGSVILHRNIFIEATEKVLFWSSDDSTITKHHVGVTDVLVAWTNRLVVYWPLVLLTVLGFAYAFSKRLFSKEKFSTFHGQTLFALLVPTLMPIAWIILARQHSFNHQWFSYRHLVISLFGTALIIWYLGVTKDAPLYKKVLSKIRR